jgi:amphi-Trp domain-containing protein
MTDETVHTETETKTRTGIASRLRRVADQLDRGKPVPVDEEETVTVDPPTEPDFEVEVEREGETLTMEIEIQWKEREGGVETETEGGSGATFELYEDSAGEYRWRLRHRNGNIIADGGEGYASKQKAIQGIDSVKKNAPGALVDEQ